MWQSTSKTHLSENIVFYGWNVWNTNGNSKQAALADYEDKKKK